jgi:hypothetical protein
MQIVCQSPYLGELFLNILCPTGLGFRGHKKIGSEDPIHILFNFVTPSGVSF